MKEISKNRKGVGLKAWKNCDFSPFMMALTLLTFYFAVAILIGLILEVWQGCKAKYYFIFMQFSFSATHPSLVL